MRAFLCCFFIVALATIPAYAQEEKPPSLVDQLLSVLGNKNLPPVQIKPPAGILPPVPGAPTALAPPRKAAPIGGLEIATNFLPVYNLDRGLSSDEDAANAPPPMVMPFFSSAPVNKPQRNILSLVIMIPDSDREAARAYAFARSAQDVASATHPEWYASNSIVIAPQFLNPEDVALRASQWPDGGSSLLSWTGAGWIYGADNVIDAAPGTVPNQRGMSSYEALDFMLLAIARKELFPDLERVVIAGSGAGGDFVQRYAALGQVPDILASDNIKVRFVTANAWSYLYFDKNRAVLGEAGIYAPPETDTSFADPKPDVCPSYNTFPYGLDAMPPYGRRQGDTAVRLRYDSRVVLYLAGKNATHPLPDTAPGACALVAEGRTLNERAHIFYQHVSRLYGDNLPQTQRFYEVPDVAEEAPALWKSACGAAVLYGDGACEAGDKLKMQ